MFITHEREVKKSLLEAIFMGNIFGTCLMVFMIILDCFEDCLVGLIIKF